MKTILVILLMFLTSCKDHEKEKTILIKYAKDYCKYRQGIDRVEIRQYESITDTIFVFCNDGSYNRYDSGDIIIRGEDIP